MTGTTKRYALTLLTILTLSFTAFSQQPSKKDLRRAQDLMKQAENAFAAKDYRKAIERYAAAIVILPRNPNAHYWKGYAHYILKEFETALKELNAAQEFGYSPVDVARIRWAVHRELGNSDAALSDLEAALQKFPDDQLMLRSAGDIYFEKKRYKEALAAYQRAALGMPNDGDLYFAIAQVQYALGDVKGQDAAAEVAVSKPGRFPGEARILLADAYRKQKKYDKAAIMYEQALASRPDDKSIYHLIGDLYRIQGLFDKAIDIIKRALRIWPTDGDLFTDISWYYSLAGQHENAVQAALSATRLLPDKPLGYTNLCRAYNDLGQWQNALGACNSALRLNPNDGETNFYLGRAYQQLGRQAEASKAYDRAVAGLLKFTQDNPEYSDGFYLLGNAYFANNQLEKALEAYRKCLELAPKFARAIYNSGVVYIRLKNKQSALAQYNALIPLDKELAEKLKAAIDGM